MPEYAGVGHGIVSLILVLLGQFDLAEIIQASNAFGFAFFFVYIVIMFFILMNIFLAILGEAYSECTALAKEEKEAMVKTKNVGFRQWVKFRWRMFRRRANAIHSVLEDVGRTDASVCDCAAIMHVPRASCGLKQKHNIYIYIYVCVWGTRKCAWDTRT